MLSKKRMGRVLACAVWMSVGVAGVNGADFDLALSASPTSNVVVGSGTFVADQTGAVLNLGDLKSAQEQFGLVAVSAAGSVVVDVTGMLDLRRETSTQVNRLTEFTTGGSIFAGATDFALSNAGGAGVQSLAMTAAGVVEVGSIDARLRFFSGVTSTSPATITLQGTSVTVNGGIDTSVDAGFDISRSGGSVTLVSKSGNVTAGAIKTSAPLVTLPGFVGSGRVSVVASGAVTLGVVDTGRAATFASTGRVNITGGGDVKVQSVSAGGSSSDTVSIRSTNGSIWIPGGIITSPETGGSSAVRALGVTLAAAGSITVGDILASGVIAQHLGAAVSVTAGGTVQTGIIDTRSQGASMGGNISVTGTGGVKIAQVIGGLGGFTSNVDVTASTGPVEVVDDVAKQGGTVALRGNGVKVGSFHVSNVQLSLVSTSGVTIGNVKADGSMASVSATGDIVAESLSTVGPRSFSNYGDISLKSSNGSVVVHGDIDTSSSSSNDAAGAIDIASGTMGSVMVDGVLKVNSQDGAHLTSGFSPRTVSIRGGDVKVVGLNLALSTSIGTAQIDGKTVETAGLFDLRPLNSGSSASSLWLNATQDLNIRGPINATGSNVVGSGEVSLYSDGNILVERDVFARIVKIESRGKLSLGAAEIRSETFGMTLKAGQVEVAPGAKISGPSINIEPIVTASIPSPTTPRRIRIVPHGVLDPTSSMLPAELFDVIQAGVAELRFYDGISIVSVEAPVNWQLSVYSFAQVVNNAAISGKAGSVRNFSGGYTGTGTYSGGAVRIVTDISPGNNGIGLLNFVDADVTLENLDSIGNSGYRVDLSGGGTDLCDVLRIAGGSLTLSNESLLISVAGALTPGDYFEIVQLTNSTLNGTFYGLPDGAKVGTFGTVDLYVHYTSTAITLTAIPEPTGVGVLLGAMALLVGSKRKR